jgi:2-haloacid dehalogenase
VLDGFDEASPHDDVRPAFEQLRAAGVRIATLTNGTAAVTRGFLERTDLDGFVDEVWDVEAAGFWKPALASYRWAVE